MKHTLLLILSLLFVLSSCRDGKPGNTEIVVLYTTDAYGFILPYDFQYDNPSRTGTANFASLVREQRAIYGDRCIVVDNGNKLPGGPSAFYYNFIDTISEPLCYRSERLIGYDLVNLGRRDPEVAECFKIQRHDTTTLPPTICCNLIDTRTGQPYLKPYEVLERDGVKVAIIGFVSPLLTSWLYTSEWNFLETQDMIEAAYYWMNEVREKHNPDIVIGLCSCSRNFDMLGRSMDTYKNPNGAVPIGKRVPGFDVILLGDSDEHITFETINDDGQNVTFVQPGMACTHAGQVRISLQRQADGTYSKEIHADVVDLKKYKPDQNFCNALKGARDSIYNWFNRPIGYLQDSIIGDRGLYGPDFYRDLINSAQLWWSGADISFASLLVHKMEIASGPITMSSIFKIYPFEHEPRLLKMNGEDVRRYLEWSTDLQFEVMTSENDPLLRLRKDARDRITYFTDGAPKTANDPTFFTAAGGIRYTIDLSKPKGQRVTIHSMSNGAPFNPRKDYTVFVNSFQFRDGGKYFSEGLRWDDLTMSLHELPIPFTSMRQVIAEYIQHTDTVRRSLREEWDIIPEKWWTVAKEREQDRVPQPRWK